MVCGVRCVCWHGWCAVCDVCWRQLERARMGVCVWGVIQGSESEEPFRLMLQSISTYGVLSVSTYGVLSVNRLRVKALVAVGSKSVSEP